MNEKPRPNPEITKLANALIKLQEAAETAQSIDNSEGLVDQTLAAGLSKADVNRSTSSS